MPVDQTKSVPAYSGARFDSGGFCLTHSDVRLCRLTVEGNYKTIRKICFKCGSGGLMMTNRHAQKATLHKFRKKSLPHREMPSAELLSASDGDRSGAEGRRSKKKERRSSQYPSAGARQHNSQDLTARKTARSKRRSTSPYRKGCDERRGRTLSPLRKILHNSKRQARPSSSEEVMKKKLTKEKIQELYGLMPPLYKQSGIKAGSSRGDGQSSNDKGNQNRKSSKRPTKQNMPFDRSGYCRAHPEVRLAKKDSKGDWNVVSSVCPQCCVSAVLALNAEQATTLESSNQLKKANANECSAKGSRELVSKVSTITDQYYHTEPTTPSSSTPLSPDSPSRPAFSTDYFTSGNRNILGLALDIYRGERMVTELNKLCMSEKTAKHRIDSSARRSNKGWDPSQSEEPPSRRL